MTEFKAGDLVSYTTECRLLKGTDNIFNTNEVCLKLGSYAIWTNIENIKLVAPATISPDDKEKYDRELYELESQQEKQKQRLWNKYYEQEATNDKE